MPEEEKTTNTNLGKKILIIEDDKFLGELLARRFKQEDFNFDLAADGEIGLAKAQEMKPDLILLDLILPGMSGFEVLKKLKSDLETKDISVIILSNLGQKDEIDKGLGLGAVDFLVKAEFDLNDIIVKIRELFKK